MVDQREETSFMIDFIDCADSQCIKAFRNFSASVCPSYNCMIYSL